MSKLRERLDAAADARAAEQRAQGAAQREKLREQARDAAEQTLGEKTGEQEKRPGYGLLLRDQKRLPEGTTFEFAEGPGEQWTQDMIIDGIRFRYGSGPGYTGKTLMLVLTCETCGALYPVTFYSDAELGKLLAGRGGKSHKCEQEGVDRVVAAARAGRSHRAGLTARGLLQRAAAELRFDE